MTHGATPSRPRAPRSGTDGNGRLAQSVIRNGNSSRPELINDEAEGVTTGEARMRSERNDDRSLFSRAEASSSGTDPIAASVIARLQREVRLLKVYALAGSVVLGACSTLAFRQASPKTRFTEIDVERINVVEPDGKLRMVISNRPRSIGPIYKGKPFGYAGGGRPGIIFFNDEGTENGGLTFTGKRNPDGTYVAQSGFSFDQFDQDQVLYFQYNDNNGRRRLGFTIADRVDANVANIYDMVAERDSIMKMSDSTARNAALRRWQAPRSGQPLAAPRVFFGRDVSRTALVTLADPSGQTRLRLAVDSLGAPSLEFLDAAGKVVTKLPN